MLTDEHAMLLTWKSQVVFVLVFTVTLIGCRSHAPQRTTTDQMQGDRATVPSAYAHAAVAADHPAASLAGVEILKKGGNAVDAAVATSFCLSVVRPYSCGIGGGGFMLIFTPGHNGLEPACTAINYRETCPAAIDRDFFARQVDRSASRRWGNAIAVPGTVKGLAYVLEKYGTMELPVVLEPAIRVAEEGFRADADFVAACEELRRERGKIQGRSDAATLFLENSTRASGLKVGDVVRNPRQARALRLIAEQGPDAFYGGDIGRAIVDAIGAAGGHMTGDDLKKYQVREVEPLRGRFRGHAVYSMPPPSSGGIAMQQALGMLDAHESELSGASHNSANYVHLLAEAMKHAFADRSEWLADPEFVEVPVARLTDPRYLAELADRIQSDRTLGSPFDYGSIVSAENPNPLNDHGTSHFCVVDPSGMAVACTETINLEFGSLVEVPEYGFFLNNEMDDFTTIPGEPNAFGLRQSDKNLPQPGKRPLSSMSPTIMVKDGRAALIAGASGGPRIITGTLQAMLNCLLFEMPPVEAVHARRFHHQWLPNVLRFEKNCATAAVREKLRARGHDLGEIDEVGNVQLIRVTADGIHAASDPRTGGAPAGY